MARKIIAGWHKEMAKRIKGLPATRGTYDEIVRFGDEPRRFYGAELTGQSRPVSARDILDFYRDCLVGEYCEFDRKGRGTAVNHDLYAYDPAERVAIVQARQAFRRIKNGFLNVHKTYFLVGHNELTRQPFRHPVSASTVRAAVRKHGANQGEIVRACQAWLFQVTPSQLAASVRQGDVLLTPCRSEPIGESIGTVAALDSHIIEAAEVRCNGHLFARDLTIRHAKGQHREVMATGWHRVTLAREAPAWDFAARLGD